MKNTFYTRTFKHSIKNSHLHVVVLQNKRGMKNEKRDWREKEREKKLYILKVRFVRRTRAFEILPLMISLWGKELRAGLGSRDCLYDAMSILAQIPEIFFK